MEEKRQLSPGLSLAKSAAVLMQILVHFTTPTFAVQILYAEKTVYLNSNTSCNLETNFTLGKYKKYLIRVDRTPEALSIPFQPCRMTFQSQDGGASDDAVLCLRQEHNYTIDLSHNVSIEASDTTKTISMNSKKTMDNAEFCSSVPSNLHIDMRKEDPQKPANLRGLISTLSVNRADSPYRYAYLSVVWCGAKGIILENSFFSLWNREPVTPYSYFLNSGVLRRDCDIEYKMQLPGRKFCLYYKNLGIPDCSGKWQIEVREEEGWDPDTVKYGLGCSQREKIKTAQAWCSPLGWKTPHLLLARTYTARFNQSQPERPKMFRLVVADFGGGGADEFKVFVEKELRRQAEEAAAMRAAAADEDDREHAGEKNVSMNGDENKNDTEKGDDEKPEDPETFNVYVALALIAALVLAVFLGTFSYCRTRRDLDAADNVDDVRGAESRPDDHPQTDHDAIRNSEFSEGDGTYIG